jgi:hypothetical protein
MGTPAGFGRDDEAGKKCRLERPPQVGRDRLGSSHRSAVLLVPTRLICLENTHNFAGGSVMSAEHCADLCERAHELGIPVHMDGARIFNAAAALNTTVAELTRHCDSVQFCLVEGVGRTGGFGARRQRTSLPKLASGGNVSAAGCGRSAFSPPQG